MLKALFKAKAKTSGKDNMWKLLPSFGASPRKGRDKLGNEEPGPETSPCIKVVKKFRGNPIIKIMIGNVIKEAYPDEFHNIEGNELMPGDEVEIVGYAVGKRPIVKKSDSNHNARCMDSYGKRVKKKDGKLTLVTMCVKSIRKSLSGFGRLSFLLEGFRK